MEQFAGDNGAPSVAVSQSIRRYWAIVVVTLTVFVLGAAAYEALSGKLYVAQATVLIRPVPGNAYSTDTVSSTQNATAAIESEGQLVYSDLVTQKVTSRAATAHCLATNVVATVPTNSLLVKVTYTAASPRLAQLCSGAFAQQYLDYRRSLAIQTQQSQLTALNREAQSTAQSLISANADAHSSHPSADAAANVRLYTTRLAALQTQIGVVQSQSTQPGSVVVRPDRPTRASGLGPKVVVLAAALVGLLVGLVLAIWRGSRKRGVVAKAGSELAGVPTLASVATFRKLATGMPVPSIESDDDFRLAAIALLVNTPVNRAIAVASVTGDNSISAVSFRLARALVVSGFQVVLIDAGETNPTVAEVVGVDDRPGLSEMLSGADAESIPLPVVQGVEILPSGELSAGPSGPGGSVPRMRGLVDELRATADFVLINSPSLDSPTGLGQLLCVDSTVLVVDERSAKERDLARARQMIDRMNVDLLGIINAQPAKRSDKKGKPHARAKISSRGAGSATGGATAADRSSSQQSTAKSNSDASAKDPVAGRSNASAKPLPWRPIRRSQ